MAEMWYYLDREGQHGPITFDQLTQLAETGRLDRFTAMVWQEGLADWQKAASVKGLFKGPPPPPAPVLAASVPSPPTSSGPVPVASGTPPFTAGPKTMAKWIYFWFILLFGLAGFAVSRVGFYGFLFDQQPVYDYRTRTFVGYRFREEYAVTMAVANLVLIPYVVFFLTFVYKKWKYLTRHPGYPYRDTSAGAAVGLLFVPFFNLYWIFVVFGRFVARLNELLRQTATPAGPISGGLAVCTPLFLFILAPALFIAPGLADALWVTGLVLLLIYICRVSNTINALYRSTGHRVSSFGAQPPQ